MADVTVKHLADMVKIPTDKLLQQMQAAGLSHEAVDAVVSDDEKQQLLAFLKKTPAGPAGSDNKISLKRKSLSTLKVAGTGGKSKTVNVEVRKKRTYVKTPETAASEEQAVEEAQVPESTATNIAPTDEVDATAQSTHVDEQNTDQTEAIQTEQVSAPVNAPINKPARTAGTKKSNVKASERKTNKASGVQLSSKTKDVKLPHSDQSTDAAKEKAKKTLRPEEIKARQEADEQARKKTIEEARAIADTIAKRESEGKTSTEAASEDDLGVEDAIVKQALEESFAEEERRVKRTRGKEKERVSSKSEREKERKINRYQSRPRKVRLRGTGEHGFQNPTAPVTREVKIGESITVADVANQMSIKGSAVVKELFKLGVMSNINQSIDQETAVLLVEELGHTPVPVSENAVEKHLEAMMAVNQDHMEESVSRPPVVTIMGHVDHGKTSLLDYIRRAKVADGEAGGITQHIGAYHVEDEKGVVTFLDTPGHAAFTAMRARGAQATDIVVLVVAADDGVKPQTVEAIAHAKAAGVPIIVAMNKIDKDGIDLERVRNELSVHGVISEEWGGDTQFIPLSAKTGEGVDALLDAILLQAEVLEITAPNQGPAKGVVIESRLDRGRGVVASFLVQEGELKIGDTILAGEHIGKIRAMYDEVGRAIESAGPSIPVEILGLGSVPESGEEFVTVPDEKKAREVADFRRERTREKRFARAHAAKLENIFDHLQGDQQASVNLIIKADVRGSMEAIVNSLVELSTSEVQVVIIASGVGGINESDANLAVTSSATVIGFNTRADATVREICDREGVDIRYYSVIYDIIDDVKKAMSGLLKPEHREEILGIAEVRDVFRSSKFGTAAGCMVVEGTIFRNKPIRVLRDDVVVFKGELESLRRFKDDAAEVRNGFECGVAVKSYNDVKPGDKIEVFDVKIISRSL